jgi:hypothetical protein
MHDSSGLQRGVSCTVATPIFSLLERGVHHTGCKYFEHGSEAYKWCERRIYHAEDVADMLAKPAYLERSRKYCAEKIAKYKDPRWLDWELVVGQRIEQEPKYARYSWCCNKVIKLMGQHMVLSPAARV